jgi:hypothetical protein
MPVTGTGVGEGGEAGVLEDRAGVGPTDAGTDALAAIDGDGEGSSLPIGRAIAATTRSATTRTPRPIPAIWANLTRPSGDLELLHCVWYERVYEPICCL